MPMGTLVVCEDRWTEWWRPAVVGSAFGLAGPECRTGACRCGI